MRGKPTRVFIKFVKTDGTGAANWVSAPNNWNKMSQKQRDAWAIQAARSRHPGAKDVEISQVDQA